MINATVANYAKEIVLSINASSIDELRSKLKYQIPDKDINDISVNGSYEISGYTVVVTGLEESPIATEKKAKAKIE